jgi:hypothetical protein
VDKRKSEICRPRDKDKSKRFCRSNSSKFLVGAAIWRKKKDLSQFPVRECSRLVYLTNEDAESSVPFALNPAPFRVRVGEQDSLDVGAEPS